MGSGIEMFRTGWQHTRGLTYDFIAAVPEDRWEFPPHDRHPPPNHPARDYGRPWETTPE